MMREVPIPLDADDDRGRSLTEVAAPHDPSRLVLILRHIFPMEVMPVPLLDLRAQHATIRDEVVPR